MKRMTPIVPALVFTHLMLVAVNIAFSQAPTASQSEPSPTPAMIPDQLDHAQAKLVRVTRGSVFDVMVDIRRGSPNFGKWAAAELSEANRLCLFAEEGFAHGFLVLSDIADFQYKCSDFYSAQDERGLPWDDPEIGIDWPLGGLDPVLSERDRGWKTLVDVTADYFPVFVP